MSYSLNIHPGAVDDAEQIASYIGKRSFEGMLRWLDAYDSARERLKRNPFEGGLALEEGALGLGLREVLFKTPSGNPYRAVYIVDADRVTILRVRGQGQPRLTEADLPHW